LFPKMWNNQKTRNFCFPRIQFFKFLDQCHKNTEKKVFLFFLKSEADTCFTSNRLSDRLKYISIQLGHISREKYSFRLFFGKFMNMYSFNISSTGLYFQLLNDTWAEDSYRKSGVLV
jgi:hypothetical protein